jgi:hypothetical protein
LKEEPIGRETKQKQQRQFHEMWKLRMKFGPGICRGFKLSRSSRKPNIGQLAIETEDGDEDYEVFTPFSAIISTYPIPARLRRFSRKSKDHRGRGNESGRRNEESDNAVMNRAVGLGQTRAQGKESGWSDKNARQKPGGGAGGGDEPQQDASTRRTKVNDFRR